MVVRALQFEQGVSLTATLTSIADVAPHVLLLGLNFGLVRLTESELKLHALAPTCRTLIDPPRAIA
jgi:hypothetical protein